MWAFLALFFCSGFPCFLILFELVAWFFCGGFAGGCACDYVLSFEVFKGIWGYSFDVAFVLCNGSKFLPEGSPSWQPINNFMQPTHHRMPDDIDNCYFWRDKTHCIFLFCRYERIWDLSNLQEFKEPSIILKFMYHVY